MWTLVCSAWEDIPQERICKLISTMPLQMQAMIEAHRGNTC
jgi:hypothetical protein